jgi:hypothetical protein
MSNSSGSESEKEKVEITLTDVIPSLLHAFSEQDTEKLEFVVREIYRLVNENDLVVTRGVDLHFFAQALYSHTVLMQDYKALQETHRAMTRMRN